MQLVGNRSVDDSTDPVDPCCYRPTVGWAERTWGSDRCTISRAFGCCSLLLAGFSETHQCLRPLLVILHSSSLYPVPDSRYDVMAQLALVQTGNCAIQALTFDDCIGTMLPCHPRLVGVLTLAGDDAREGYRLDIRLFCFFGMSNIVEQSEIDRERRQNVGSSCVERPA